MRVSEVNAELGLPFGLGKVGGKWAPDESERAAAWELLVELLTRVAVVELGPTDGLMRESLISLREIFPVTRQILRRHGPGVAHPAVGDVSFAFLAISVLSGGIRPFLGRWHPLLSDHEARKPPDRSSLEWEREWNQEATMRKELTEVQMHLRSYAGILSEVCDARGVLNAVTFSINSGKAAIAEDVVQGASPT